MSDMNVSQLKEIGLKVTPQRLGILKILEGNPSHPSAEAIYEKLVGEFPYVSFATVYNTLSALAKAGKIQEVDIDPKRKRFDPSVEPHQHFYCNECGRVFDVVTNIAISENVACLSRRKLNGHKICEVQLNLRGICKDCLAQGRSKERNQHG